MEILDQDIEREDSDLTNKHVVELKIVLNTLTLNAIFLGMMSLGGIMIAYGTISTALRNRSYYATNQLNESLFDVIQWEPFILFSGIGLFAGICCFHAFRVPQPLRTSIQEDRTISDIANGRLMKYHVSLAILFAFGIIDLTYLIVKHSQVFH